MSYFLGFVAGCLVGPFAWLVVFWLLGADVGGDEE